MRGQLMRFWRCPIALICAIALPVNAEQALPTATSRTLPDVRPDIDLSGDANSSTDTLQPAEATGQHRVYASLPPVFALVEQMLRGIEEFTPLQLVQPQLDCVRLYDMSDWDYIQLSNAEICVIWGEGLESFAGTLTSAESGPAVITLADAPPRICRAERRTDRLRLLRALFRRKSEFAPEYGAIVGGAGRAERIAV